MVSRDCLICKKIEKFKENFKLGKQNELKIFLETSNIVCFIKNDTTDFI